MLHLCEAPIDRHNFEKIEREQEESSGRSQTLNTLIIKRGLCRCAATTSLRESRRLRSQIRCLVIFDVLKTD